MGRRFWVASVVVGGLIVAGLAVGSRFANPTETVAVPQEAQRPEATLQGYEYGVKGSRMQDAAIVSSIEIGDDGHGSQEACITIRKGPSYADNDPDKYGYPGCTLLNALVGDFFEDSDSAQVVICWKDAKNQAHFSDNLVEAGGPTLGRKKAATWYWAEGDQDAVIVWLPLGPEAVSATVLVVYTDVMYLVTDPEGPEDGPAVIASWDAVREKGRWQVVARDEEVGIGCRQGMERPEMYEVAKAICGLIEAKMQNHYTLWIRNNIGRLDPADKRHVIEYDSGFDIVPVGSIKPIKR